MYTFDENIISDLHKDARGYRPRGSFFEMWNTLADADKQDVWDMLVAEMEQREQDEKEANDRAVVELRKSVRSVMNVMNCDWKTALRTLADAEGVDIRTSDYEFGYFMYLVGVNSYTKSNEIKSLYYGKEAA